MLNAEAEYSRWRFIDYRPAIQSVNIDELLRYAMPGMKVLEIGCGSGTTALELARRGLRVEGIDINERAIAVASQAVRQEGLQSVAHFRVADVLSEPCGNQFDIVLAIRVFTCFPDAEHWNELLKRIDMFVRPGGILYINDFAYAPENRVYQPRCRDGERRGWRKGNFPVHDEHGQLIFVAHHHPESEISQVTSRYEQLHLSFYRSLSMNGNPCSMFEFIGRAGTAE